VGIDGGQGEMKKGGLGRARGPFGVFSPCGGCSELGGSKM
jgi:hypothetical protein